MNNYQTKKFVYCFIAILQLQYYVILLYRKVLVTNNDVGGRLV